MTGSLPYWFWLHVVRPSWISLLAAPLVLVGYWLLGRRRRAGWLFVMASQVGLVAIAVLYQQFGLVVVVVLVAQCARNWWTWGRSPA